jgi:ribosomal protein S18 acetylase RimI-like enzyme
MQRALESVFERLYGVFDGARFEWRSDLVFALLPGVPIPQFNGAWVCEDSDAAAGALAGAVAEVEAAGEWPWVQTRSGHNRTRQAALALGLTHTERIPGMAVRQDGFVEASAELEIGLILDQEIDEANVLLATCFEAPFELFDRFSRVVTQVPEARWYVGRADDAIVSTALGFTLAGATGIFDVATPSEHRGRGYGAALTSHALRDGFDAGSEFGYLQSSTIGHGVYERLGFRDIEEYTLLTRPPNS